MPKTKKTVPALKTNEEVARIIDMEGMSYAILDYMGSDSIEDQELAQLWDEANVVLTKINNKLEEFLGQN